MLKLPPKIKIFAWKVVNHALPVASALHKRKIVDSASCSRCKMAWESIGHALFTCKHAKTVWKNTPFRIDFSAAHRMMQGDYLIHLAGTNTKMDFKSLICVMWCIWYNRNKVLHGGTLKDPASTAAYALRYIDNYRNAKLPYCSNLQQPSSVSSARHGVNIQMLRFREGRTTKSVTHQICVIKCRNSKEQLP